MDTNVIKRSRGRPREFELDAAIQVGQHLFHQYGYENVSVAKLTEAIGITAPSFYTAFGSKSAFFKGALKHYSATVVPLDRFLIPGQSPRIALGDMLVAAAHAYAAHPDRRGCFILEHAKAGTTEWGTAATQIAGENRDRVLSFLKASDVSEPKRIVDYVAVTMLGLSAAAREGWEEERLIGAAKDSAAGLDHLM
ncbi:TetR/AcrR family transcriptional regulator [Pseudomonas frederiksbergensis]|uniref:HTH-type transcriptional repressor BdcR n=1 Tax=Pseudomonas frederiksbergensis TaxID=104087 RepID=A0A6L5BKJ3_9PSED|nr:TetR/AcrR family transcriptional regulator [Pseudomonas frederiksbergensis]KAF2389166.1 HTH-type transcriptional repressor BdcR [Pseudomonas frederiksbergensis]